MATATPQGFRGVAWAWVHPLGVLGLPSVDTGLWFVADVKPWYIDDSPPLALRWEAVGEEGVRRFMIERGADPEYAFRVVSRPYIPNPWPSLDRLSQVYGGACSGLPDWADMAPFEKFELGAIRGQSAGAFKSAQEIWVKRNRVGYGAYWLASAGDAC